MFTTLNDILLQPGSAAPCQFLRARNHPNIFLWRRIKLRDLGMGVGGTHSPEDSTNLQRPEGPLLRHAGPGAGGRVGANLD
jgi:hypothetical protein